ncbi:hypothetical protein [Saccharothrix variisporea]|uniref:Uncharacterized protein n=1 Tax=Saccharothrix variisporea TaxID=543527 RepID=A0A495XCP0_9PSEU|nr:hypothetical protein [Saccharothrix variisporea]RKT72271.1 hypothetical protein DFJ66_5581 [Saccharothrix variisporea]
MRGRCAALGLVVGTVSTLVTTGVATAGTTAVAAAPVSMNAPVGIAAVAFGVVGLVTGLVRRRRAAVQRAQTGPNALVEPVQPVDAPVTLPTTALAAPTPALDAAKS